MNMNHIHGISRDVLTFCFLSVFAPILSLICVFGFFILHWLLVCMHTCRLDRFIEVRDSPHGIFGLHTAPQGSYQMGGVAETLPPPSSPPPAIAPRTPHPAHLARWRVIRMAGPIPECLVPYQNAWSFSILRFTGHTRMRGPSVFPDLRVIPECLVL